MQHVLRAGRPAHTLCLPLRQRPSATLLARRGSNGRSSSTTTTSTTRPPFVPPASLRAGVAPARGSLHPPPPPSPTFYTGRATFFDLIRDLTDALRTASTALRAAHLFPIPTTGAGAGARPPIPAPSWKKRRDLAAALGLPRLLVPQHRRIVALLAALHELRHVALAGNEPAVAQHIAGVLALFEKPDLSAARLRRPVVLDALGRSYTLGRRKESSARVWIIATQPSTAAETATATTTTVLVNNRPLAAYFPNAIDRQRVVRPLKLAGLLGAYNVFALVRGGGTTGQAGAIAHGIAKGIVAHIPDVEIILRRAKLLRRDPRMVERKKTGLAKARKRYAWVKR